MKKTPRKAKLAMLPPPTISLPQSGFLLRVTGAGQINIIQGDEENEPPSKVAFITLSPREAKTLLDALPEYIRVAGELHRDSEVPCV